VASADRGGSGGGRQGQVGGTAGIREVLDLTIDESLLLGRIVVVLQGEEPFTRSEIKAAVPPGGLVVVLGGEDRGPCQSRPHGFPVQNGILDAQVRVKDGSRLADKETRAVRVVEQTVAHDHVAAIALEVEGLAIAAAPAPADAAPLAVLEEPILGAPEHRPGHPIEGNEVTANVDGHAVAHGPAINPAYSLLPLQALLEETVEKNEVGEIVTVVGVRAGVEVVRVVGPNTGCQPAKDTILDRDVLERDVIRRIR